MDAKVLAAIMLLPGCGGGPGWMPPDAGPVDGSLCRPVDQHAAQRKSVADLYGWTGAAPVPQTNCSPRCYDYPDPCYVDEAAWSLQAAVPYVTQLGRTGCWDKPVDLGGPPVYSGTLAHDFDWQTGGGVYRSVVTVLLNGSDQIPRNAFHPTQLALHFKLVASNRPGARFDISTAAVFNDGRREICPGEDVASLSAEDIELAGVRVGVPEGEDSFAVYVAFTPRAPQPGEVVAFLLVGAYFYDAVQRPSPVRLCFTTSGCAVRGS